jgi:hypothetical protein
MSDLHLKKINPFAVTRAVDLSDADIQRLWINLSGDDASTIFRPTSPVPLLLLGGKGSGKTHWMRYHSFPLQRLRHRAEGVRVLEGLKRDGYLGIYILLGGLNAERFSKRGQSDETWRMLFAYYCELWISQELLHIVIALAGEEPRLRDIQQAICAQVLDLINAPGNTSPSTFEELLGLFSRAQSQIDRTINNALFGGTFEVDVLVTAGKLIFGIPKILIRMIPDLEDVVFSYQLDEFENISKEQQKHINTLIRERTVPSTFRIGGRLWGVKTYETYADREENKEGSEFEKTVLDDRFRRSKPRWQQFSHRLVGRRIEVAQASDSDDVKSRVLDSFFDAPRLTWDSQFVKDRLEYSRSEVRPHLRKLDAALRLAADGEQLGHVLRNDLPQLKTSVSLTEYPVLEKINILLLYQAMFRRESPLEAGQRISQDCQAFLANPKLASRYQRAVQHYASDMIAQLFREAGKRQGLYYGLPSFARMAEGLPRSLIVMLKQIFDWSIYDCDSSAISSVSKKDQERGVEEAAEWFLGTMRKSGENAIAVLVAVERIGRLFESNRFADKPVECSLLGFSVRERDLQSETQSRLNLAEQHSFLIRTHQIDRNTKERVSKFQLNAILSPKWMLPIARRGIVRFKPEDVDIIFDPEREPEFDGMHREWKERMTAPFFGRSRKQIHPSLFGNEND